MKVAVEEGVAAAKDDLVDARARAHTHTVERPSVMITSGARFRVANVATSRRSAGSQAWEMRGVARQAEVIGAHVAHAWRNEG